MSNSMRSIHPWRAAILAVLVLGLTIFSFESASAKTAKEIDVSADVALEQFEKQVRGGKEFLVSTKGVLAFPAC